MRRRRALKIKQKEIHCHSCCAPNPTIPMQLAHETLQSVLGRADGCWKILKPMRKIHPDMVVDFCDVYCAIKCMGDDMRRMVNACADLRVTRSEWTLLKTYTKNICKAVENVRERLELRRVVLNKGTTRNQHWAMSHHAKVLAEFDRRTGDLRRITDEYCIPVKERKPPALKVVNAIIAACDDTTSPVTLMCGRLDLILGDTEPSHDEPLDFVYIQTHCLGKPRKQHTIVKKKEKTLTTNGVSGKGHNQESDVGAGHDERVSARDDVKENAGRCLRPTRQRLAAPGA